MNETASKHKKMTNNKIFANSD